jgi:hypothetical protein
MTTILAINAVCTLLAGLGMGGHLLLTGRRARRDSAVEPAYVYARTTQPLARD